MHPYLLKRYYDHATKISKILRDIDHKLFHVGSSFVEGLLSKGIADILLTLPTWRESLGDSRSLAILIFILALRGVGF
ncbi:MAG: GrpB family protein [SAR324 cluster bacterium]|uniref:GrpB family protein n=1 Tax=SAR324 cluster bacterium TaxID=2024889 RepID=A0A7X9FQ24_9DELT|nr:GrpB family protein [SAR324 cluster bacterium]